MIKLSYIFTLLLIFNTTLISQIVTDRPSESTSIYIVKPRTIQFESGLQYNSERVEFLRTSPDGQNLGKVIENINSIDYPQLLVRLGVSKNFELRMNINSSNFLDADVLPNSNNFIGFGLKYRFINGNVSSGVILNAGKNFPSNNFTGLFETSANIPIDIQLPNNFFITSNSQVNYAFERSIEAYDLNQIILIGKSYNDLSFYSEYSYHFVSTTYIERVFSKIKTHTFNIGSQKTWQHVAIDLRLGLIAFPDRDSERVFVNFGFSYLID